MNHKTRLIKYIEVQSQIVIRQAPLVLIHPSGESVHEMRRAIRRIRETLWVFNCGSKHREFRALSHTLKRVGKRLGHVRELDVAIQDARKYGINENRLKTLQKLENNKLKTELRGKKEALITQQLIAVKKLVQGENMMPFDLARKKLRLKLVTKLGQNIHSPLELHRLRITLRKTQYALELMGRPVAPLKPLQKLLGNAHDLEFLQSVVKKNSQLKNIQESINRESVHLVKPALCFALTQLEA